MRTAALSLHDPLADCSLTAVQPRWNGHLSNERRARQIVMTAPRASRQFQPVPSMPQLGGDQQSFGFRRTSAPSLEQTLEDHLLVHLLRTAALSTKRSFTRSSGAALQRTAASSAVQSFGKNCQMTASSPKWSINLSGCETSLRGESTFAASAKALGQFPR